MIPGLVFVIIAFVCIVIQYAIVLPKKDKVFFRMYEYRDKLALIGMENEELQDTRRYILLCRLINSEIAVMEEGVSITKYFKAARTQCDETDNLFESILYEIEQDEMLVEIYRGTSKLYHDYFSKKINWLFRFFVIPYQCLKNFRSDGTYKSNINCSESNTAQLEIPLRLENQMRLNI